MYWVVEREVTSMGGPGGLVHEPWDSVRRNFTPALLQGRGRSKTDLGKMSGCGVFCPNYDIPTSFLDCAFPQTVGNCLSCLIPWKL